MLGMGVRKGVRGVLGRGVRRVLGRGVRGC